MNFSADAGPPRTPPEANDASGIHYSLLFAAPPERAAASAMYAFWCEMERMSGTVREPTVASVKLTWWREELDRTYDDRPLHPLTRALRPAIAHYQLPRAHFTDLLAGVAADLALPAYTTVDDLDRYCRAVGGSALRLLARIFGSTDRATDLYAHDLGTGLQLARLVQRATTPGAHAIRYLPGGDVDLPMHARRAVRALLAAGTRLPASERARQTPAAVLAAIAVATLSKLEATTAAPGRPIALSPLRMLWIAWRTAREART